MDTFELVSELSLYPEYSDQEAGWPGVGTAGASPVCDVSKGHPQGCIPK